MKSIRHLIHFQFLLGTVKNLGKGEEGLGKSEKCRHGVVDKTADIVQFFSQINAQTTIDNYHTMSSEFFIFFNFNSRRDEFT